MPLRSPVILAVALSLALTGCAGGQRVASTAPVAADWRAVATANDRERLRGWRDAWNSALAQATSAADLNRIQSEGPLLRPDAALSGAELPAGAYRCRVIKLGSQGTLQHAFTAYPAFDCRVTDQGEVDGFDKVSGSQRPQGLVFPDSTTRRVFLGTLMLGDETRAVEYGADRDRDMAGLIERVGQRRWRLVLPYPRFESIVDVIELVPAA